MRYVTHYAPNAPTPQTEPIPGREAMMVRNEAGGYAFPVDDWTRLDRFLILGAEGGSYYVGERKLTIENAQAVVRCIGADGARVVERVREISLAGRAPKADPAIFVLAMAAKTGNDDTRGRALGAVTDVCRTGAHLFAFAEAVQAFGGWGRGTQRAIANWYNRQPVEKLAYGLVKYRQRDGWTHRDLLRLAHVRPADDEHDLLYRWTTKGDGAMPWPWRAVEGYERLTRLEEGRSCDAAKVIREYGLPWEAVPSQFLNAAEVWEALLESMPMTAMVRNLGKMSSVGLVSHFSAAAKKVAAELGDIDRLRASRIHPMQLLAALRTYASGRGVRGSLTWEPVRGVVEALDSAFYASFGNVQPTGKRFILGVDVSGSMHEPVSGLPMDAFEAAASLAFVVQKTEPEAVVLAFTTECWVTDFTRTQRVDDAIRHLSRLSGGTDCSIPLRWAGHNRIEADLVAIFTDEETWAGPVHVVQALASYRHSVNANVKFVADNLVATGTSVTEGPEDGGSLRVVGFDLAVPGLIADFATS